MRECEFWTCLVLNFGNLNQSCGSHKTSLKSYVSYILNNNHLCPKNQPQKLMSLLLLCSKNQLLMSLLS